MRAIVLAVGFLLAAVSPAAASSARVWVTTPDGAEKMHDRGTVDFHPGGSSALTVSVDPSRRYQSMDGFGASITDSSARVLYRLSKPQREAAMRSLFADDKLSFLRQPMGASDFVEGPHYTYDDVPAGKTDYRLRHFSIAHDRKEILPLLRRALALNPKLKVMGTPWSPPAWMKTNQSLVGGRLIDSPRIYDAYARYFVKFVRAYKRAGVPIYALTLQNEPQNRKPNAYPGMDMPVRQEAKLIEALGPKLQRAGLRTKLLGYDHNWEEHPNDVANTPPGEDPETEYPTDLLKSRAGRWLAGTAFHCYAGDVKRQTELQHRFPQKGVWFTECSGSHGPTDPPAQVFSDTLKWHTRNVVLGVTRNWGKTVVNWNLALDPNGGPHNGGCDTCTGVLTVGPGDTFSQSAEYFTLGHLARFVAPGRGADRQHLVRHHRLERADHGRRVPQPRRLDRARRPQRERRPAHVRGRAGGLVVRLHAAGRRARDVRVEGAARRRLPAARSAGRADGGGRRRRHHDLERQRPEPRPRPHAARAPRGRRRRHRRASGPGHAHDRRQDLDRRRRRPAHDVRHPGDAGAVPADRLQRTRDGRGRADLPLRR